MAPKAQKPAARKKRTTTSRTGRKTARPRLVKASPAAIARATELTVAGVNEQNAGNLDAAEALYRKALKLASAYPHALHFLGVVYHQKGDNKKAVKTIGKAIALDPDQPSFHSNLGAAQVALEDFEAAAASFRTALQLSPGNLPFLGNLATTLKKLKDWKGAVECYEEAIALTPGSGKYLKRLGDLHNELERFEDAATLFERCLELEPDDPEIENNLAFALERSNRLEESEPHYRRAAELNPESPEIIHNLGVVLQQLGREEEAQTYLDRAMESSSENWARPSNLAAIKVTQGRFKEAQVIYERLLDEQPDSVRYLNDYGMALAASGRPMDAIRHLNRAIELDPDLVLAYCNRATAYSALNDRKKAVEDFQKALSLRPDSLQALMGIGTNLVSLRRYDEAYFYARALVQAEGYNSLLFSNPHKIFRTLVDFDQAEELGDLWRNVRDTDAKNKGSCFLEMLVLTETESNIEELAGFHREWAGWLSETVALDPLPPFTLPRKRKKIRLGIMSSDLRSHSVGKFVMPLIQNYDRDAFEVYCYSPIEVPTDTAQQAFIERVEGFRFIANSSDRQSAEMIRGDEIDILFELNGFTQNTKIGTLAHRAAPVQIEWLGYPFTTGMKEIDYLLLDRHCRPDDDSWLTEKALLMPDSWVCFGEFPDDLITMPLPFERNDGVFTFGTMNNPYKLTPQIFDLWTRVLDAVPNSRFLVVRPEAKSKIFVSNVCKEFAKRGVGPERLYFVNNRDTTYEIEEREFTLRHYYYYDEIDISLDTYPVTGGTTTCDALWMGVPVVSMFGRSIHQRLGLSILNSAGLGDLCVATQDEFVDKAVALTRDRDRLADIRVNTRDRLRASPLCDAPRFTENLQNLMLEVVERHGLR